MPKKKTKTLIKGLPVNYEEKLSVLKANPLYGLWRSDLTLAEFKILDIYLSRINSHDPDRRTVRLERGEIEKVLGVKKINRSNLETRIKNLGTMVPITDKSMPKGFRMISLFERADCDEDEDGIWQVDLTCTPSARKYFFNADNIGYYRYKLQAVSSLRSRYSYLLFQHLETNRHKHLTWETSVEELRDCLAADSDTYKEFKRFNGLVLKPSQKELEEVANCHFTYEPVKRGRSVKTVRFTLEPLDCFSPEPEQEPPDPNQVTFDELVEAESDYGSDPAKLFAEACNNEFTPSEIEEIMVILASIPEQKLPSSNGNGDSLHLRTFRYLEEKYLTMNRYAPDRRFNYLVKMLKKDATNYQGTV